jgi:hypothetical protein
VPDPTLFGLVVEQLAANPPKAAGADELVLAAFEEAASLEASLAGGVVPASSSPTAQVLETDLLGWPLGKARWR